MTHVEAQDIFLHCTGIIKRITQHETVLSKHFQKAPEFAYTPAYHHSPGSQLSLSGILNIALSAKTNMIRAIAKSRSEFFVTTIVGPDTVTRQEYIYFMWLWTEHTYTYI